MAVQVGTGYIAIEGDFSAFNRNLATQARGLNRRGAKIGKALGLGIAGGVAVGAAGLAVLVKQGSAAYSAFTDANKVAKQTNAVLKSTGGVAKVSAKDVDTLAASLSRKAGIDDELIASGENILLTFTNVRNEVGRGNDIFNQATRIAVNLSAALGQDLKSSNIQLGKALNDPIKGVTALSRVGVSFTAQQKEQITTLQESGDILGAQKVILAELNKEFAGSAAAQSTASGKMRVAWGNVQESIGKGLAPVVDQAIGKLTELGETVQPKVERVVSAISKAFNRSDLDLGEKLALSMGSVKKHLGPVGESVRTELEEEASKINWSKVVSRIGDAQLPAKFFTLLGDAGGEIVKGMVSGAPKLATAFGNAFVNADIFGKALLAAFAVSRIKKLIGPLAGLLGGGQLAGTLGTLKPVPVFVTNPGGGIPGSPKGGTPVPLPVAGLDLLKKGAKFVGRKAIPLAFAINLVDEKGNPLAAAANVPHTLTFGVAPKILKTDPAGERNLESLQTKISDLVRTGNIQGLEALNSEFQKFSKFEAPGGIENARKEIEKAIAAARETNALTHFAGSIDQTNPGLVRFRDDLVQARAKLKGLDKGSAEYKETAKAVRSAQRELNNRLTDMLPVSDDAKGKVKALGINFSRLGGNVAETAGLIAAATNQVLAGLGAEEIKFSLKMSQKYKNFSAGPGGDVVQHQQRGGLAQIIPGTGDGDKVPVLAEPGEGFINKRAVRALGGPGFIDYINRKFPRFQTGGMVRVAGDPNATGGRDTVSESVAKLAAFLVRRFKLDIGYGYDPGGGHVSPGHNVTGTAIDVYPGPGGNWGLVGKAVAWVASHGMKALYDGSNGSIAWPNHGPGNHAHLELIAGILGGPIVDKLERIDIAGPDGMMKDILSGAERTMRRAANKYIEEAATQVGTEGPELSGGTDAELMRRISKQRGWNFADWWELDRRETSHGANLSNPSSTARLRGQFLDFNWGKYGPGSDPRQNPTMDQQINAMADYIAERYGNPTAALDHHKANNWYQLGGIVQALQRGGVIGNVGRRVVRGLAAPKQLATLQRTLKTVRTGKPKQRKAALKALTQRFKRAGVPGVLEQLTAQMANAEKYEEWAGIAEQLNREIDVQQVDRITGEPLFEADAAGNQVPVTAPQTVFGQFMGKEQLDWLRAQASELLSWRNAAILALEGVIKNRLAQFKEWLTDARARMKELQARISKSTKRLNANERNRGQWQKQLAQLQKKPKQNAQQIAVLKERISQSKTEDRALTKQQKLDIRERDKLKSPLISTLTENRSDLVSAKGELETTLGQVQGRGVARTIYSQLPPLGTLGGQIFNVQFDIGAIEKFKGENAKAIYGDRDLTQQDESGLERLRLEKEIRALDNQRVALNLQQSRLIQEFPSLQDFVNLPPFGGSFQEGGIVPGPPNAARTIIAHGGETITAADASPNNVRVVIQDERVRVYYNDVEQIVQQVTRKQSRHGGRPLPGQPGALG